MEDAVEDKQEYKRSAESYKKQIDGLEKRLEVLLQERSEDPRNREIYEQVVLKTALNPKLAEEACAETRAQSPTKFQEPFYDLRESTKDALKTLDADTISDPYTVKVCKSVLEELMRSLDRTA